MFILEYFLTLKSFASALEVFNDVCSGKEASDKVTINGRTTKFRLLRKQLMQKNTKIFRPSLFLCWKRNRNGIWFQHNAGTAHIENFTTTLLKAMFGSFSWGWLLATLIPGRHANLLISVGISQRKNVLEYPTRPGETENIIEQIVANTDRTSTSYRCIKHDKMGGGLSAYLLVLKTDR
jgi:hypothetical protein